MASNDRTPSPNRKTAYSARSVDANQPCAVGPATSAPSVGVNAHELESRDATPLSAMPQSDGRKVSNEHVPTPAILLTSQSLSPLSKKRTARLLGIPAFQGHSYTDRSYDYMRKYPPDAEGKELDPGRRVWKVYLDECESYDNDMIKGFQDTIDSLLVFAALFSSVVTGFVGQTSQALEPDYARIGVSLLFEQVEVLRAAGNATRIQEIPRSPLTPDSTTHSSLDVAVNWLFFASLAFSLATAFIAVLIKQWLQAFTALVPGDAKVRSLTRQFRFAGLEKWKLPEIINILPLFLHLALALFLLGLCLFVSQFHPSITMMVGVVACYAIAFYLITSTVPAVHLDCPYRLPILFIPASLCVFAFKMIHYKVSKRIPRLFTYVSRPGLWLSPLYRQEQFRVSEAVQKLEGLSLAWLFSHTPNPSVQRISLHGVNRFLQDDIFAHLDESNHSHFISYESERQATSLRDSLPLERMTETAICFFKPEAPPEDGPLLRDLIFSVRRIYSHPILDGDSFEHILCSPYSKAFLEADVYDTRCNFRNDLLILANKLEKWDVVAYVLEHTQGIISNYRLFGCYLLALASASAVISHQDWVAIFTLVKEEEEGWQGGPVFDFSTFSFAEWSGSKLLHIVSSYGTVAALKHVISQIPNLDCNRDVMSQTPLWFLGYFANINRPALSKPAPLAIQTLLSAGADPNIADQRGNLPLHDACYNAFRDFGCTETGLEVIEELLKATTNINQRSGPGLTPLDLLEKSDRKNTEEGKAGYSLMRRHGARLAEELTPIEEGIEVEVEEDTGEEINADDDDDESSFPPNPPLNIP